MERLTDEQREFAAKNHNLIYKYANKKNIPVDEYYGVLAIGLCKATTAYDKSKGKFSTLAMRCMDNEYQSALRHKNKKSTVPESIVDSYDVMIEGDDGGKISKEFVDNYSYLEIFKSFDLQEFFEYLTDKEKIIVDFLISGMTHKEISDKMDCTRQNVSFAVKRIRGKLVDFMSNN